MEKLKKMKGLARLKKFANDFKSKSITDLIETLYAVEVDDERYFEVFACVRRYRKEGKIWICDYDLEHGGCQNGARTRENAVSFLMMRDMENKYEIHGMTVSNYSKWIRVKIQLIVKGSKVPTDV